ncbi:hypothetical protein [Streptomyces sp. NPDC007369]
MKKRISALIAAVFAVTALVAGGAAATGGESTIQAGIIANHP